MSELQGEGNIIVYGDVCPKYRVKEILLCTVMRVWITGWEKCYCVQWWVAEVQGKGKVTVYSDVWRVSEVQVEGNITVYIYVSLM